MEQNILHFPFSVLVVYVQLYKYPPLSILNAYKNSNDNNLLLYSSFCVVKKIYVSFYRLKSSTLRPEVGGFY